MTASKEQIESVASAIFEAHPAPQDVNGTLDWLRENRPAAFDLIRNFTRPDLRLVKEVMDSRIAAMKVEAAETEYAIYAIEAWEAWERVNACPDDKTLH